MTSVELRGEEIIDLPRRSLQLNTQLKLLGKERLEKKKNRLAGIQTLTLPFPHPPCIVFFFVLGSAFGRLNLLLFQPQEKKYR